MIKTKEYVEFESLKWVCKEPIPSVGSEVNVKINGIGIPIKDLPTHPFDC